MQSQMVYVKNFDEDPYEAHYNGDPIYFRPGQSLALHPSIADTVVNRSYCHSEHRFRLGQTSQPAIIEVPLPEGAPPESKVFACPVEGCGKAFDVSRGQIGWIRHQQMHVEQQNAKDEAKAAKDASKK